MTTPIIAIGQARLRSAKVALNDAHMIIATQAALAMDAGLEAVADTCTRCPKRSTNWSGIRPEKTPTSMRCGARTQGRGSNKKLGLDRPAEPPRTYAEYLEANAQFRLVDGDHVRGQPRHLPDLGQTWFLDAVYPLQRHRHHVGRPVPGPWPTPRQCQTKSLKSELPRHRRVRSHHPGDGGQETENPRAAGLLHYLNATGAFAGLSSDDAYTAANRLLVRLQWVAPRSESPRRPALGLSVAWRLLPHTAPGKLSRTHLPAAMARCVAWYARSMSLRRFRNGVGREALARRQAKGGNQMAKAPGPQGRVPYWRGTVTVGPSRPHTGHEGFADRSGFRVTFGRCGAPGLPRSGRAVADLAVLDELLDRAGQQRGSRSGEGPSITISDGPV